MAGVTWDPHYFFPPARAYPLNRFLFALKSDDAVRARYLGDPETTLREADSTRRRPPRSASSTATAWWRAAPIPTWSSWRASGSRMAREPSTFERF